jgi:hypothetical protein
MKSFVHHDSTGAIHSLITVNAPKGMTAMLTPAPGESAAEIEDLGIKGVDVDAVRQALRGRRVDAPHSRCKLTTER